MKCPNCGTEQAADAKFCSSCGTQLPESAGDQPAVDGATAATATDAASDAQSDAPAESAEKTVVIESTDGSDAVIVVDEAVTLPADEAPAAAVESAAVPAAPAETSASAAANAEPAAQEAAAAATGAVASSPNAPYAQAASASAAAQQAMPGATAGRQQAAPGAASQAAASSVQQTAAPTGAPAPTAAPTATAAAQQPVYMNGCIGSAWKDIKQSDGWVGRVLLLGLINLIPILNWIVPGYAMRWSRQLMLGKIESMPKSVFVDRGFVNGAFWFVISLVFGIVASIASGILCIVPILGVIAGMVLMVFVSMFQNVAVMRAAVADRLGAGFDISTIWQAFKKNLGSLFVISFVPALVVGVVIGIICTVVVLIAMAMSGGNLMSLIMMAADNPHSYADSYYALYTVGQLFLALTPAFLLCYLIGCFADAFLTVLTFRAMGHWTARYATEWLSDPTVTSTAYTYPL